MRFKNMDNILTNLIVIVNVVAVGFAVKLFHDQYKRIKKPINEVLFSNDSSTCHSDINNASDTSCSNRYCLNKNLRRIIKLIDNSQHYICLAMYRFHLNRIEKALIAAHRRGVIIQIITTMTAIEMQSLISEGILL